MASASNTAFFIQWIDATTEALTNDSLLPTTADVIIGGYPSAEGTFFNPFVAGYVTDAPTADTAHNNPRDHTTPFNTEMSNFDGSIGNVNYWKKEGSTGVL